MGRDVGVGGMGVDPDLLEVWSGNETWNEALECDLGMRLGMNGTSLETLGIHTNGCSLPAHSFLYTASNRPVFQNLPPLEA